MTCISQTRLEKTRVGTQFQPNSLRTRYSAFSQIVPFLSISDHLERNGCQCRAMYTTPRRPFEKVVDIVSVRNQILIFWFLKLELQILVIVGYKSVRWNHPSAHQHWSRSLSQTKSLTTINTFNFKFKSSVGRWIDTCYHYRKMSTIIKIIVRPTRGTMGFIWWPRSSDLEPALLSDKNGAIFELGTLIWSSLYHHLFTDI